MKEQAKEDLSAPVCVPRIYLCREHGRQAGRCGHAQAGADLIHFPVGDWSGDGHRLCEYYTVESTKPVQEVREAHFRAQEVLGFDIGDICRKYDVTSLSDIVLRKLKELGFDPSTCAEHADRQETQRPFDIEDTDYLTPRNILDVWLFLLNCINGSLKLNVIELPKLPAINFYGYDDEGRHLKTPGYGVMYAHFEE